MYNTCRVVRDSSVSIIERVKHWTENTSGGESDSVKLRGIELG